MLSRLRRLERVYLLLIISVLKLNYKTLTLSNKVLYPSGHMHVESQQNNVITMYIRAFILVTLNYALLTIKFRDRRKYVRAQNL